MKRVSFIIVSIIVFVIVSSFASEACAAGMTDNPAFINGKIRELSNGDIEVTSASGKMLIKKATHTAGHLYRFGELFEQQGDDGMAKKYYRLCLKKDPEHRMAKVKLGMEKMTPEEEEAERKKEEERRKLNAPPDGTKPGGSGDKDKDGGKLDLSKYSEEAVQHYKMANANYRRALKLAKSATRQDLVDLLDKAIEDYKKALKLEPKFHEARHDLCVVCRARGSKKSYELGLKEADKYIKSNKEDVEIIHLAAYFAGRLGKVSKAASLLKKGLKIKPNDPELALALTACYLVQPINKAKARKAVKLLQEALEEHTDHIIMRKTLARAMISAEMPEEAKAAYNEILKINASDPDALCGLGRLAYHESKFEDAIQYLEKALAADPKHHDALAELVLVYKSMKNDEKQAAAIKNYLKHHPKGQNAKLFKGWLEKLKR
ncbi:MAG: tetratricopeptide repeat protein [Planctomycetota bacterium]|jgi:tetratricopeptide (TPR) repeat protein